VTQEDIDKKLRFLDEAMSKSYKMEEDDEEKTIEKSSTQCQIKIK
jgi:hypothetical protein